MMLTSHPRSAPVPTLGSPSPTPTRPSTAAIPPSAEGILAVSLADASLRWLVGGLDQANNLTVSRDGRMLAVAAQEGSKRRVFVTTADPSHATPPATTPLEPELLLPRSGAMVAPEWSPTEDRVALIGEVAGRAHVFVADPDGSHVVQLTHQRDGDDHGPTWSPGGKQIAFVRDVGEESHVFVIQTDGAAVERDLTPVGIDDRAPAWSPDGTRIAVARTMDVDGQQMQVICVLSPAGRGVVRLTNDRYAESAPRWSRGGETVVFVRSFPGNAEIFSVPVDGGGKTNLTLDPANDGQPRWSPDGKWIAYVQQVGDRSSLWIMDAEGRHQRQLTTGPVHDDDPVWLPDGSAIVFIRSLP